MPLILCQMRRKARIYYANGKALVEATKGPKTSGLTWAALDYWLGPIDKGRKIRHKAGDRTSFRAKGRRNRRAAGFYFIKDISILSNDYSLCRREPHFVLMFEL